MSQFPATKCEEGQNRSADLVCVNPTEDGREMKLDVEKMKFRDIQTEVDRHSRALRRKEELDA